MWKVQGHSEDRHGNYPIVIELVFLHQAIVIQKVLEVFQWFRIEGKLKVSPRQFISVGYSIFDF